MRIEIRRFRVSRVGIATGAALVGNVGSEEFRNYVTHGDAVNLAARLQTTAKAGQVVVSASTYALIRDAATVHPLGRFTVKGKSEEVERSSSSVSLMRSPEPRN